MLSDGSYEYFSHADVTRNKSIGGLVRNYNNLIIVKTSDLPDKNCISNSFYSKFALWNARSLTRKTALVCDYILSEKIDLFVVTETWLKESTRAVADITNTLPDHQLFNKPRIGRGGGVCVILKKGYSVKQLTLPSFRSFEYIALSVSCGSTCLCIVAVYRPPPSKKNGLSADIFFNEFPILIENLAALPGRLLVVGDFNFHLDNVSTNRDAILFLDLLDSTNLIQHVETPTHNRGHLLDLVITRNSDTVISDLSSSLQLPSDHAVITGRISVPRPKPTRMFVNHRKLRNIDLCAFAESICASSIITEPCLDLDSLVHQYNTDLTNVLDMHAPARPRFVTLRPHAPWFDDSLREAKAKKRSYERKYRSSGLEIDKQIFRDYCNGYYRRLNDAKTSYHRNRFSNVDQRSLFREVEKMTSGKRTNIFPSSLVDPADQFLTYFNDKIRNLHSKLCELPVLEPNIYLPPCTCSSSFSSFLPVTATYIKQIVLKSPTKFCELDPIQTVVLKECLHVVLTPITNIVNLSLGGGSMPDALKVSQLAPVLKKISMDPEDMSSFRPISNLQFISKTIERVASPQLIDYLMENKIYPNLQSAFRKGYSTETALLLVQNDLLEALDSGHQALLVMLDSSAAFDTIDHQILLGRLKSRFGICGTALSWFRSYLTSRTQYVKVNGKISASTPLLQGVPQGSVLGPLLFSLYVSPLEDIFAAHDIDAMIYADDTQLYIILKKHDSDTAIQRLEHCLHDIQAWCLQNKLVLNDGKTDAIYLHSAYAKSYPAPPSIYIGDSLINIKTEVRDLGAIVDENLSEESCKFNL